MWTKYLTNLRDDTQVLIIIYIALGFMYIDPTLVYNPSTGNYGFFGEDWDNESTSELANDLNKDETIAIYDQDSYEPISMDFEDPLLYQPHYSLATLESNVGGVGGAMSSKEEMSVRETLKQGLEDPQIRNEMLKLITQKQGEF